MATALITKPLMGRIISLLDWLYKLGAQHAWEAQDRGKVYELIERTDKHIGVFGFLTDDYTVTWKEWQLRIEMQVRRTAWGGILTELICHIRRFGQSHLSIFYNIAQYYYNLGMQDYIENPRVDMTLFNDKRKIRISKGKFLKMRPCDYQNDIQLKCFDLERRDRAYREMHTDYEARRAGAFTSKQYDLFIQAVSLIDYRAI